MKATHRILLTAFTLLFFQKVNAQSSLSVFGLVAKEQNYIDCSRGWGFDWKSSPVVEFGKLVPYGDEKPKHSLQLRVGGNFYNTVLRTRVFENTQMIGPELMSQLVKSKVSGLNFDVRISRSYFFRYVPYFDLFAGVRRFKGHIDHLRSGDGLYRNLKTSSTNVGCTIGMLYRIGAATFLDAGVILTYSSKPGKMLDVNSGRYTADGFMVDRVKGPKAIAQLKIGLTFEFNGVRGKKFTKWLANQNLPIQTDSIGRSYYVKNGKIVYVRKPTASGNYVITNDSDDSDGSWGGTWGGSSDNSSGGSSNSSSGGSSGGSSGSSGSNHGSSNFSPAGNNNSYSPANTGGGKSTPGSNPQSPAPSHGNKGGGG